MISRVVTFPPTIPGINRAKLVLWQVLSMVDHAEIKLALSADVPQRRQQL